MSKIREKPFWTRVALLGIAMPLFMALVLAIAILIFEPDAIIFPIVVAVISTVVGSLIYFVKPWGLIAAVLGGLFALMVSSDGIDLALGTPRSIFDFIFPVVLIPSALFLLTGGVMGLVQHFKHANSQEGPSAAVMAIKGVVGVVALLLVISAILTLTTNGSVSAEDKQGAQILTAHHSEWNTNSIDISASGTTKIVLKNRDPILHTFTVKDLGINETIGPGEEKLIEVASPGAGGYGFICKVMGHEDMAGVLQAK